MAFVDKKLKCRDCNVEFVFTAGEQEFYASKGFGNEPTRCRDCRSARKNEPRRGQELHSVVCAECGVQTQVPFRPRDSRPVYCRDCFAAQRA